MSNELNKIADVISERLTTLERRRVRIIRILCENERQIQTSEENLLELYKLAEEENKNDVA